MDWRAHWARWPRAVGRDEYCKQVGRTANGGIATPEPELRRVVEEAVERMRLRSTDRVLDLCCGNGLLTARFGSLCAATVGVDYSEAMIAIAREHFAVPSVRYLLGSATELDPGAFPDEAPFTRVIMFESLAYFSTEGFGSLLDRLGPLVTDDAVLLFTGVLDAARLFSFYDTPERQAEYRRRVAAGEEKMGHWWEWEDLRFVAESRGWTAERLAQDPSLNTAHYRFDLRLER